MNGQSVACSNSGLNNSVGLGLRSAHIEQIIRQQPEVPWFEVLLDNHTAQGGLIPRQLAAVRHYYPLSFHCVGMSLGGVDALDMQYLATIKRMISEYKNKQDTHTFRKQNIAFSSFKNKNTKGKRQT